MLTPLEVAAAERSGERIWPRERAALVHEESSMLMKRARDTAIRRRVVERTNAWHNRGFKKLLICSEKRTTVIDAFIALANAIIITRRLIREAWTRYRWDTRPTRHP